MNRFTIIAILACAASVVASYATTPNGPTMGWSSWNTYRVNISDSLIASQADALVSTRLNRAGYDYINIDDGFFGGRDSDGRLLFHPRRFPQGMKWVVDHIHSLGLKAGIYSDAGANTCGNFWDADTIARGVGLYGHDADDISLYFDSIGFDFIKVDFCGGMPKQNTDSLSLDERQRYSTVGEELSKVKRPGLRLNICRWAFPGTWAADVASSWRISGDITDRWWSVRNIINRNLYLSAYCRNGAYNDMDMLEVGRGLTAIEDSTHFAIWCIMSSPLIIGCDLRTVSDSIVGLLSNPELIALNQDVLRRQAYVAREADGCYLLVKDILEAGGTTRAIAFYNPTDSARIITADLADDFQLGSPVKLRDVMQRRDVEDSVCGSVAIMVPAHGVRVYRAEADKRLMRHRYEAETGFISSYQELRDPITAGTGYYVADRRAGGGMAAAGLGRSPENFIEWTDIRVPDAGIYKLTIAALPFDEASEVSIEVNGSPVGQRAIPSSSTPMLIDCEIPLRSGPNTIRLLSPVLPIPPLDYIDIHPCDAKARVSF